MKRLLVHYIILFLSSIAYPQDFNIPDEGAEWNIAEVQGTTYYAKRIISHGDTTINSFEYAKLYEIWSAVYFQTGVCEFDYSSGPFQMYQYRGAIRTDENQKVHFVSPNEDTSRLIYDFSVRVGDTIQIDGLDSTYSAYIQDIDTITIDEHPRKRFTLRGARDFHDEWIDGIGSLYGLFATFTRPWEKFVSELTCYRESGNRIYPNETNCDRCDLVTTSLDKQFDSPISIYPNPLDDKAIISWPKAMYARKLLIYDLAGRIIVENDLRGFEHLVIKRQEMKTGVLLVEIIDNSGISHKSRMVVQ